MTLQRSGPYAFLVIAFLGLELLAGFLVGIGSWKLPLAVTITAAVIAAGVRPGLLAVLLLLVAALFQIPLVSLGSYSGVQLSEIVVPLLFIGGLVGAGARRNDASATAEARPRLLLAAVAVYAAVVAANYLRSKYVIASGVPIQRPYYAFVVALGTYGLTYALLARRAVRFDTVANVLLRLSTVMSLLGIAAVVVGFSVNFGDLTYSVSGYADSTAVRVGFLDIFGVVGLALVVAGFGRYRLVLGVFFAAAVVVSGGRSAAIGVLVGILLYLLLSRRWPVLLAATGVALVVIPLALPTLSRQSQFQRLTDIGQQTFAQNERSFYYDKSLSVFDQHPLIGTGLGVPGPVYASNRDVALFEQQQLAYGGHATYNSLLKNFGLLGFVPFVAALALALAGVGRCAARHRAAAFLFILLTEQAISLYASGNGSDPFFFWALGAATAVMALIRTQDGDGTPALAGSCA